MGNLDKTVDLIQMFLDYEGKLEHPEETYAGTGRICKLQTERLSGLNPEFIATYQSYIMMCFILLKI